MVNIIDKFLQFGSATRFLIGKPLEEEQQEKAEAAQRMAEIENPSFFRRHFTVLDNLFFGSPEKTQAILDYQRPEHTNLEIMTRLADDVVDFFAERVAAKLEERGQISTHECKDVAAPLSTPSVLKKGTQQL